MDGHWREVSNIPTYLAHGFGNGFSYDSLHTVVC